MMLGRFDKVILIVLTILFFAIVTRFSLKTRALIPLKGDYSQLSNVISEGSDIRQVSVILLGATAVAIKTKYKKKKTGFNPILASMIILFLFWCGLSVFWSDNIQLTIRRLLFLSTYCFSAWIISTRYSVKYIVLWVYGSTLSYLLIILIVEIVSGGFRPFSLDYRFANVMHPNPTAVFCSLLILSGISLCRFYKKHKLSIVIGITIGLLLLMQTRSRTAFSALIVALSIYFLISLPRKKKIGLIFTVSIVVFSIMLLELDIMPSFLKVIFLGRTNIQEISTFTGRTMIWNEALFYISARFFIGFGYYSFWTPERALDFSLNSRWTVSEGHSAYLDIFLGIGLIGLSIFMVILILGVCLTIKYYGKKNQQEYYFWGALLLYSTFHGLFESTIAEHTMLMFIIIMGYVKLAFMRKLPVKNLSIKMKAT